MHKLAVGPHFERPTPFPVFKEGQVRVVPDSDKVKRSFRQIYDWKAYSPEALSVMEAYWDSFIASVQSRQLPPHLRRNPTATRSINLGTFNGCYQKAWVRNGYPMYGIEIADVIDELHEYGLEGHRDNFFDMSSIKDEEFDFAVLDRSICTKNNYESWDRRCELNDGNLPDVAEPATALSAKADKYNYRLLFERIFRIIRKEGALIGILYGWYSKTVIAELAKYGALTIWPTYSGLLGFRVVKNGVPTELPSALDEDPCESRYFRRFSACKDGVASLFLPTNEVVILSGNERRVEFAPLSEYWHVLSK